MVRIGSGITLKVTQKYPRKCKTGLTHEAGLRSGVKLGEMCRSSVLAARLLLPPLGLEVRQRRSELFFNFLGQFRLARQRLTHRRGAGIDIAKEGILELLHPIH